MTHETKHLKALHFCLSKEFAALYGNRTNMETFTKTALDSKNTKAKTRETDRQIERDRRRETDRQRERTCYRVK